MSLDAAGGETSRLRWNRCLRWEEGAQWTEGRGELIVFLNVQLAAAHRTAGCAKLSAV